MTRKIVAAVDTILDKDVAASAAADAEGLLAASTKDDTFTFITGQPMLTGYDRSLAAFRRTYAMLQGRTHQIVERHSRVLSPTVVLVSAVSEGTYTDRAGFSRLPSVSGRQQSSYAAMASGKSRLVAVVLHEKVGMVRPFAVLALLRAQADVRTDWSLHLPGQGPVAEAAEEG